jgi:hypothetical protein
LISRHHIKLDDTRINQKANVQGIHIFNNDLKFSILARS